MLGYTFLHIFVSFLDRAISCSGRIYSIINYRQLLHSLFGSRNNLLKAFYDITGKMDFVANITFIARNVSDYQNSIIQFYSFCRCTFISSVSTSNAFHFSASCVHKLPQIYYITFFTKLEDFYQKSPFRAAGRASHYGKHHLQ